MYFHLLKTYAVDKQMLYMYGLIMTYIRTDVHCTYGWRVTLKAFYHFMAGGIKTS